MIFLIHLSYCVLTDNDHFTSKNNEMSFSHLSQLLSFSTNFTKNNEEKSNYIEKAENDSWIYRYHKHRQYSNKYRFEKEKNENAFATHKKFDFPMLFHSKNLYISSQ